MPIRAITPTAKTAMSKPRDTAARLTRADATAASSTRSDTIPRLGIGPKHPAQMALSDFVLGKFTSDQQTLLNQKLETHVQGLELLLSRGAEPAMNQLNRREPK